MAKLDFPDASYSPWVAPNNVIYTYIGTSPNGYWEANTANAATNLTAVFVERTGSSMTGDLLIGGTTAATADIALNANGSATFAGRVDVGGLTVDSNLTPTSGTSVEHFYSSTGGVIQAFDRDNGNLEPLRVRGSTWDLALDGSATFAGAIGTSGQNTLNEASALKFSQESANLSQIRAYGSNSSTSGSLEFKVGPSTGAPLTPLTLNNDGSATFAGDIQATKPRSSTAGSSTGGLCINPSDSTIYYNFRVDQVDNALRIDTTAGSDRIKFTNDGGAEFTDTGKFGSTVIAKGGTSGANVFLGLQESPTGSFDPANANVTITAGGSATFAGNLLFANSKIRGVTSSGNGLLRILNSSSVDTVGIDGSSGSLMLKNDISLERATAPSNVKISGSDTHAVWLSDGKFALKYDGSATFAEDASINGLTVGRGKNNISTNTTVGAFALFNNTTGDKNAGTGWYALADNTTGAANTATGYAALFLNTTGAVNTAVGSEALRANTTGSYNTAIGEDALTTNTTASHNTAVGTNCMHNSSTGANNVSVGSAAMFHNTTGADNVAVGKDALYTSTTGLGNTAVGTYSLMSNTTGTENTASGIHSLRNNTTANENVATGYQALRLNTTGNGNVACGARALYSNTTASNNVAVGYFALYTNTTGHSNCALGTSALRFTTTGIHNTATGMNSLYSNTTGGYNVAAGYSALQNNTTGSNNTATGFQALVSNTTGGENSAYGMDALLDNTTGSGNTAAGWRALGSNTTGAYNAAFGQNSLYSLTTGSGNTALGRTASNSITTGQYNVSIGKDSNKNLTTGSGNIGIGYLNSGGTYAPTMNPTTHNNRLVLGHTSISNAYVKVAWTVTSDERDKMNFAPVPYGLDFVNQLKPTAYQFKVDRDTETPNGDVRYGFKAQDILALEGDNPVIIDTEDADHLKYKGEHLVPILVNAVQELTTMVKELQDEIKTLKG